MDVFENNVDNLLVKVKVIGVNTASNEKISGGLAALNYMLEQNLQGVNYIAIDRQDVKNLGGCKAIHKFRLLDMADERNLVRNLRGADLIFIVADGVWENIKAVALTAHCAKKIGVPVIFMAGGNFEDAEDEIIFDALIKLPSKNFEFDTCKIVKNFIELSTLPGQPKIDIKAFAELLKDSVAVLGYGERDGKNAVVKAAKAALEQVENNEENFKAVTKILFNVTASKGNLSLEEAQKLAKLLKKHAPKAEISFGLSIDDWLVDKVKFLLVAAQ
ncbi:MAG: hypothetical protein IKT98_08095 [Selenomonadaceae bacterium]|nr:hypothetical protein [Selenomonadaceae bacterium]